MGWEEFRLSKRLGLNADVVEQVYETIAEIDAVKKSWRFAEKLLPQTVDKLTHSVIVTSTGASNRIEGNRLTDDEVEHLYRNIQTKKFKTRDEQEVAGYIECLEFIFSNYQQIVIRESTILQLHHDMLLYSEKDKCHMGHYKVSSNRIEAQDQSGNIVGVVFEPTLPYLVKKEMDELIDWYNWSMQTKLKHPLILLANFIFEYLAIHPFQDGNGRTSRLLTNLMLLKHGYSFASLVSHEKITETHKTDYYLALNETQNSWKGASEDISAWLQFFLNVVKIQSKQALSLIESENKEDLLSQKQLMLWQWAIARGSEFSRKDAIEALGLAVRTTEASIKKLLELELLERLGMGKATRYRVVTNL